MEKRLSIPFIGARVLHYLGKIKVSKEALQERSDSPEKRLSWGKAAAGAAAAVVGCECGFEEYDDFRSLASCLVPLPS